MNALELYEQLEKDFIISAMSDTWSERMLPVEDFLTDNYKKRSMGSVCDNTTRITKVYTAVFPSNQIMLSILNRGESDTLLFLHHPMVWDIRQAPSTYQPMDRKLLQQFRVNRISIYNLHVPLDNYGEFSTSVTLAKALGIEILKPFAPYFGGLAGVFGKTDISTVKEIKDRFESVIGHRASLYQNGTSEITGGFVAVVAGGGNSLEILEEVIREGVNTFITGITLRNDHSEISHQYAQEKGINILGGTHYSTEKFACQEICRYFEKLGLLCEFIEGEPILEDL